MIDLTSCYLLAVLLRSTQRAELWKAFKDHLIDTFGVPTLLFSNRGSQFASAYWCKQCQIFTIHSETTPAYHPEANGIAESWHCMLKNAISWDCQNNKEWSNRLPMTLLGLRAQPHLDSGLSPHQQVFGTDR